MKQVKTTIILSAFALVSLVAALSVYYMGPKASDGQNEFIGEPFYPEFTDPAQASSMTLIVWDGEEKETKEFEIKKVKQTRKIDGKEQEVELWAIPAHSDYPVESPDRLRETAGSVMNIERLALQSNSKEEHERLGVIDPKDENAKLKEAGQVGDRIVLTDDSGNTVCDLIIGNAVDAEAENQVSTDDREIVQGERYYVRQPDQNEVYIARLNLQITTEFSEWIDDDLLQVGDATVNRIQFLNYDVKDKFIEKFGGEVSVRQNFEEIIVQKESGSWLYGDLKSDTEELDSGPLDTLEGQIQNLSILNVQPKPTYQDNDLKILNADLTVNAPPGMSRNDQIRIQQQVLGPMGFIIGLENEKKVVPSLLSTNGELKFATDDGLVYHMFFGYDAKMEGESFEFAGAGKTDEGAEKKADDEKADDKDGKENSSDEDSEKEDNSKKGKIMSVYVSFDPSLIETPMPPVKPVPPQKPDLGLPMPIDPGKPNPDVQGPGKADDKSGAKKESKADAPNSKSAGDLNSEPKKEDSPKTEEPKKEETKGEEKEPESKKEAAKSDDGGCGDEVALIDFDQEKDQEKDEDPKKGEAEQEDKKETPKKEEPKKQDPKKEDSKQDGPKKDTQQDPAKSDEKAEPAKDGKQDGKKQDEPPMKSPEEVFTEKMQAYDAAMQQHNIAMQQFQTQMKEYEEALEAYNKKVKDNEKKVAELNARFADWFYIVDAADLEKVKLTRADIVKPKAKEDENSGAPVPNIPGLNGIPGLNPQAVPKGFPKKEEPKKEEAKKEEPETKKADPKKEPAKSEEKAEEKPADKKDPKAESKTEKK